MYLFHFRVLIWFEQELSSWTIGSIDFKNLQLLTLLIVIIQKLYTRIYDNMIKKFTVKRDIIIIAMVFFLYKPNDVTWFRKKGGYLSYMKYLWWIEIH